MGIFFRSDFRVLGSTCQLFRDLEWRTEIVLDLEPLFRNIEWQFHMPHPTNRYVHMLPYLQTEFHIYRQSPIFLQFITATFQSPNANTATFVTLGPIHNIGVDSIILYKLRYVQKIHDLSRKRERKSEVKIITVTLPLSIYWENQTTA